MKMRRTTTRIEIREEMDMAQLATSDLFLVGSVPVASDKPEDVMRLCGRTLGDRLFALPDGEVGERRMWIGGLGATTFSKHPDLEKAPEAGPFGAYRFKPGVTSISFKGYLPYADAAISSYYRFRDLRDAGELPAGLHFQVALPTPHAAIGGYFVQDWEMLHAAYHDAIVDDISRMLEEIPAEDLVIQWDYCTELCDTVGVDTDNREIDALWPWNPKGTTEQKFATHTAKEYIGPLTEGIPAEVLYGYHLCLGTWPKCPLTPVRDLTLVVRIANAIVANTPRRVDFVHLPMTKEADRQFCAPLTDLNIGEARVFLGLEWKDGRDAMLRRAKAAREFLPSFGISHYCGYGRDTVEQMPELLADLRAGADALSSR
jgi:hypothetical protein